MEAGFICRLLRLASGAMYSGVPARVFVLEITNRANLVLMMHRRTDERAITTAMSAKIV